MGRISYIYTYVTWFHEWYEGHGKVMGVWEDNNRKEEEQGGEREKKNHHEEKMYDYENMNAGLS